MSALSMVTGISQAFSTVDICTDKYFATHRRAPKGVGEWRFQFGNSERIGSEVGTFEFACASAVSMARLLGVSFVRVLP